jgi:hypothetical protein
MARRPHWLSRDPRQHPLPTIPWDGHFTSEGNRIAAERVARWLMDVHLVPN